MRRIKVIKLAQLTSKQRLLFDACRYHLMAAYRHQQWLTANQQALMLMQRHHDYLIVNNRQCLNHALTAAFADMLTTYDVSVAHRWLYDTYTRKVILIAPITLPQLHGKYYLAAGEISRQQWCMLLKQYLHKHYLTTTYHLCYRQLTMSLLDSIAVAMHRVSYHITDCQQRAMFANLYSQLRQASNHVTL